MSTEQLRHHALVMNHVRPHVIGHRDERAKLRDILIRAGFDPEQLGGEEQDRIVVGAGEPIVSRGAPHHVGAGRFIEVAWPCGCGQALHADPDRVLHAWALHTGHACGIDVQRLEDHPLSELRGARPVAVCGCGLSFTTPEDDPFNSDLAVADWEAHVLEQEPPA